MAVQLQVAPTAATPLPGSATPPPFSIENSVADGMFGGSAPAPTQQEWKREKVRSLHYDIGVMESQKRALNQRKEDLIKGGSPDHPDAGGPNTRKTSGSATIQSRASKKRATTLCWANKRKASR